MYSFDTFFVFFQKVVVWRQRKNKIIARFNRKTPHSSYLQKILFIFHSDFKALENFGISMEFLQQRLCFRLPVLLDFRSLEAPRGYPPILWAVQSCWQR